MRILRVGACIDNSVLLLQTNDFILIPAPYYPAFTNDLGVRCRVRQCLCIVRAGCNNATFFGRF